MRPKHRQGANRKARWMLEKNREDRKREKGCSVHTLFTERQAKGKGFPSSRFSLPVSLVQCVSDSREDRWRERERARG